MAGRDRVQIRSAHLKPISHACPATLLKLGGLLGQELGEVLRTGGACRDVITIAGSACSDRFLVPSVLVSAACCTCRWRILSSASGIIPQGAMKSK